MYIHSVRINIPHYGKQWTDSPESICPRWDDTGHNTAPLGNTMALTAHNQSNAFIFEYVYGSDV